MSAGARPFFMQRIFPLCACGDSETVNRMADDIRRALTVHEGCASEQLIVLASIFADVCTLRANIDNPAAALNEIIRAQAEEQAKQRWPHKTS